MGIDIKKLSLALVLVAILITAGLSLEGRFALYLFMGIASLWLGARLRRGFDKQKMDALARQSKTSIVSDDSHHPISDERAFWREVEEKQKDRED